MTRTRAEALVLVNWKGVFYERYLLDRHVTALEGTNGAGKTTVMIAAYMVLLPDMSRLRFTNLGETGATGGDRGIWGRLGEHGRPSYSLMDFAIPGNGRLLAGVHLERKGEPSVEPTPFVVSGLANDVRLQDLLLITTGEREAVPELPELREKAASLGGRLIVFPSAREYFAFLFDAGVTPLRLGTDEERGKFNEMLHTSMTGGISRALTTELRAFLLKEEGGLADTLQRMRSNLDACRRTRIEVQESRRLEHEISQVFEAGQTMFEAAFLATKEKADELARRVDDAEKTREEAIQELAKVKSELEKTNLGLKSLEHRRNEVVQALEKSRNFATEMSEALRTQKALSEAAKKLEQAQEYCHATMAEKSLAEESKSLTRAELRRAQEGYNRAAQGLADQQVGLEELHRQAAGYQYAIRRLQEAEEHFGIIPIESGAFTELLNTAKKELSRIDGERREAAMRITDAEDHRKRYAEAIRSLRTLVGTEPNTDHAFETAQEALHNFRECIEAANRFPELERDLAETKKMLSLQTHAREKATALGIQIGVERAADSIGRALDGMETNLNIYMEQARSEELETEKAKQIAKDLESQRKDLLNRQPIWRECSILAESIEKYLGFAVIDRRSLHEANKRLEDQYLEIKHHEESLIDDKEQLLIQAQALSSAGGPFAPELIELKDRLDASLVAERFEDIPIEDASMLEARLGRLTQALVVDDPQACVRAIAERPETLEEVLLVTRETDIEALISGIAAPSPSEGDIAIVEGPILRVSHITDHPRLGKRAREKFVAQLLERSDILVREIEETRIRRRSLEHLIANSNSLLAEYKTWLAGDPRQELEEIDKGIIKTDTWIKETIADREQQLLSAQSLRPTIDDLRSLLSEAMLLDPPDYDTRVSEITKRYEAARIARDNAKEHQKDANLLERQISSLRQTPLSEEDYGQLVQRRSELQELRAKLDIAIEALSYLQCNIEALGWEAAPRRLKEGQSLIPILEQQRNEAEAFREESERNDDAARDRLERSTNTHAQAQAHQESARKNYEIVKDGFESIGIPDPSEEKLAGAKREVACLEREQAAYEDQKTELDNARGRCQANQEKAEAQLSAAEEKLASEKREAEPAAKRWSEIQDQALRHGLSIGSSNERSMKLAEVHGHVNLVQETITQHRLLIERLRVAHGGDEVLTSIQAPRSNADGAFAEGYLDAWLSVRDWLRRRLPAQIAEVEDPREGLIHLRDQLSNLEDRLIRQENDLRGASEDVARGIDVQIRKARGQVARLNKNLEGVSFGGIQGIRVRLNPVDKMEQVLRALREGTAQGLLFQDNIPIEDAFDEIFRRYCGGLTGGKRLLDYREYIHLQVEILRKSSGDWEHASPTRLSTGEAIGVGATLMMVVLTEWERDSMLLRGKKNHGSLRFLFLDEANRLSNDNLGVLFDLCKMLDLQLLIASPEVARAEGNTTYRLVRKASASGREEVLVSGRRTRATP